VDTPASQSTPQEARAIAPPTHTRRRRLRAGACLLVTAIGATLGLLSLGPQTPALVWNFSPSLPVGLYRLSLVDPVKGDVVAIRPSGAARDVLIAHGVLPDGRILLKQLYAEHGDIVCRTRAEVTINGARTATAKLRSRDGRLLPVWAGCRSLGPSEILVLAPHPSSFDSRYFGPIDAGRVIGVATPLLTFPPEETA
jgi:conjugative transfer signal peptidase TraF